MPPLESFPKPTTQTYNRKLLQTRDAGTFKRHSFSRSYRVILPSSFNIVAPSALVFSTQPPVSVYGTVQKRNVARLFLEATRAVPRVIVSKKGGVLPRHHRAYLSPKTTSARLNSRFLTDQQNINCFPINKGNRLSLRARLTLRGLT